MSHAWSRAGVVAFLLLAFPGSSAARPGDLDPTFSTDGLRQFEYGRHLSPGLFFDGPSMGPVGLEPDGDVIVAGGTLYRGNCSRLGCFYNKEYVALARVEPDGELDPGFGDGGVVEDDFGVDTPNSFGVRTIVAGGFAVQNDGRIVGVISSGPDPIVARFLSDGRIDPSFAGDGTASIDLPSYAQINALAIQDDGRIVIGGWIDGSSDNFSFQRDHLLVRLLADGGLDAGFGNGGVRTADFSFDDEVKTLDVDSQGRIVAGGKSALSAPFGQDLAVARFLPDGSLDSSFSDDGYVALDLLPGQASSEELIDLDLDPQDRPLALADAFPADPPRGTSRFNPALVRFTASGELDPTIGPGGVRLLTDISEFYGSLSLAIAGDGTILIGQTQGRTLAVGRRLADGTPDPEFGIDGWVREYLRTGATGGSILAAGDHVLVGGRTYELPGRGQLARFRLGDLSPDDADADGVTDPGDRCPGVYEPGRGCPRNWRHLTMRWREDSVGGRMRSESSWCLAQDIFLFRKRRGPDRLIKRVRQDNAPLHDFYRAPAGRSWGDSRPPGGGLLYARVKPRFDPTIGFCGGDRSKVVRVPHS